jgi:hypothetical protein
MKSNVGFLDKIIRLALGSGIVGLGVYFQNWWGLIGLVPIATALSGRCLFYYPLRVSTRARKRG